MESNCPTIRSMLSLFFSGLSSRLELSTVLRGSFLLLLIQHALCQQEAAILTAPVPLWIQDERRHTHNTRMWELFKKGVSSHTEQSRGKVLSQCCGTAQTKTPYGAKRCEGKRKRVSVTGPAASQALCNRPRPPMAENGLSSPA